MTMNVALATGMEHFNVQTAVAQELKVLFSQNLAKDVAVVGGFVVNIVMGQV